MIRKGQKLEQTIRLIEETLKASPETKVHINYRIPNSSGRKREFDVFIEAKVNGYEIKIAIECKDFKGRVPVKEIEAFEAKCTRFKTINKKVFVTSNGFQAEAINAAKDFGIELLIVSQLNAAQILSWLPMIRLEFKLLPGGSSEVLFDIETEYEETNFPQGIFIKNENQTTLNDYVVDFYTRGRVAINQYAMSKWLQISEEVQKKPFPVQFRCNIDDLMYITPSKTSIKVKALEVKLIMELEQVPVLPSESVTLSDLNGNAKAKTLSFSIDGAEGHLIKGPDGKITIRMEGSEQTLAHLGVIAMIGPQEKKD